MGNIFGGGGEAPQGSFQTPPGFNIAIEPLLSAISQHRANAGLPYTSSPWRTVDFLHGLQAPQMQLPSFQPPQQQNPWIGQPGKPSPMISPYSYVPPMAGMQQLGQGFPGMPPTQQMQQQQPQQPNQGTGGRPEPQGPPPRQDNG